MIFQGVNKSWLFISLIVVLTTLIYFPLADYQFSNFDTPFYITNNPHVNSGLSLSNASWAFTTNYMANWHPITWLSHMLDAELFGLNPGPHHIHNLLLHIVNTLLLFLMLLRVNKGTLAPGLVALLFAIHPTQIESVIWVAERKDMLFTLFLFAAVLSYCNWVETGKFRFYLITLGFFILGGMSKPMIVTFPFIALLFDYWPLRRIGERRIFHADIKRLIYEKLPFFAVSIGIAYITYGAQQSAGAMVDGLELSLTERIINAFVAYAFYIEKALLPFDLSIYYPHPGTWDTTSVLKSLIIVTPVLSIMLVALYKSPKVFVAIAFFFGTLVPVIGIVQVGGQAYADRYSYVPNIGLFFVFVTFLIFLMKKYPNLKPAFTGFTSLVFAAFCFISAQQVKVWSDEIRLWGSTLLNVDPNYSKFIGLSDSEHHYERPSALGLPYFMAGYAISRQGNHHEAIRHFNVSISLKAHAAYALYHKGLSQQAMQQYELAAQSLLEHGKYTKETDTGHRIRIKKILYGLGFEQVMSERFASKIFVCTNSDF